MSCTLLSIWPKVEKVTTRPKNNNNRPIIYLLLGLVQGFPDMIQYSAPVCFWSHGVTVCSSGNTALSVCSDIYAPILKLNEEVSYNILRESWRLLAAQSISLLSSVTSGPQPRLCVCLSQCSSHTDGFY